jgi:glutathione S-transferase
MNARRRVLAALVLAVILIGPLSAAPSTAEQARIDRLLEAVAQNQSARFIRNGSDYSGADAAYFLRRKLEAYGDRVQTVQDFIDRIASKSSTSGQLYQVRLGDGRVVPSAEFLRAELARIEAKH